MPFFSEDVERCSSLQRWFLGCGAVQQESMVHLLTLTAPSHGSLPVQEESLYTPSIVTTTGRGGGGGERNTPPGSRTPGGVVAAALRGFRAWELEVPVQQALMTVCGGV
jgi:hypothetical protein